MGSSRCKEHHLLAGHFSLRLLSTGAHLAQRNQSPRPLQTTRTNKHQQCTVGAVQLDNNLYSRLRMIQHRCGVAVAHQQTFTKRNRKMTCLSGVAARPKPICRNHQHPLYSSVEIVYSVTSQFLGQWTLESITQMRVLSENMLTQKTGIRGSALKWKTVSKIEQSC